MFAALIQDASKTGQGNTGPIGRSLLNPTLCNTAQFGFTLIELVLILVLVGIVAITALPRFANRTVFESRGFADQVQASLRYAQKIAIAQRRFVCVAFVNGPPANVTLTIGATTACGNNLSSPDGSASYSINAPAGIGFSGAPVNFRFDALGRPSAGQTIAISGAPSSIVVEAETGYVHSP